MFYKILAKILATKVVSDYIIKKAKKTPYSNIVGEDGELYMERYWLFNPYHETDGLKMFSWFPLSIRVHKILKKDADEHLHDHPWNARTFILKGNYVEFREGTNPLIGELDVNILSAGDTARLNFGEYHRIVDVCEEGAYTLFITGKYQGTWGFLVNGAKVHYKKYLGIV